jgi:hypothetical protein
VSTNRIRFPDQYQPVEAWLGETPVTIVSATDTYAKVLLPNVGEAVVLVRHLHR